MQLLFCKFDILFSTSCQSSIVGFIRKEAENWCYKFAFPICIPWIGPQKFQFPLLGFGSHIGFQGIQITQPVDGKKSPCIYWDHRNETYLKK